LFFTYARVAFNDIFTQDQGYSLRDRRAEEESREKRRIRKERANRSSDASDLSVLDVPSSQKFEINFAN